ncbi:MAG: hypothetical protein JW791_03360 [Nanoarchaeota archaeon]|nr:hypothetical protein [Nanoarchaeota archaeon]
MITTVQATCYNNLSGKKIHLIAIDDCYPFDTVKKLSFLGENNLILPELPQYTKECFEEYSTPEDSEALYQRLIECDVPKTSSGTYASLVHLNPYKIIPVATGRLEGDCHSSKIYRLNQIIPENIIEEILTLKDSDDFKDIVFIGGRPHIKPIINAVKSRFDNIEVVVTDFSSPAL